MLDLLYNGMEIRARVCVSPLSSYLYISLVYTSSLTLEGKAARVNEACISMKCQFALPAQHVRAARH